MTNQREQELNYFLQNHFSDKIDFFEPIQGDAGFRSYFRLKSGADSYIVMDCPPSYCSTEPFIEIANYLRVHSFSAPEIIAHDVAKGFLILEDFGNISVKNYIETSSNQAKKHIYFLIVDILIALQSKQPPTNLKIYTNDLLLSELALFEEWYVPYILKRTLTKQESDDYKNIWINVLSAQSKFEPTIVLRDYHVENMMYLENKHDLALLGLLDFQDALIGSPIYDLVSVLEDARIEVEYEIAMDCIKYFAKSKNLLLDDILKNYHILGAQRNSRILGVFARKAVRDKNTNYLRYMPLVRKYLDHDLSHPVMYDLKKWHQLTIEATH